MRSGRGQCNYTKISTMSFDVQNATKQPIAFYIPDIGCDFMSFTVTDPLTIPIDLPF